VILKHHKRFEWPGTSQAVFQPSRLWWKKATACVEPYCTSAGSTDTGINSTSCWFGNSQFTNWSSDWIISKTIIIQTISFTNTSIP
jgi:hypothetical protein